LWSIGRFDLGLSEKEFWRLTLRKFDVLVKRFSVELERQDTRFAMICAAIYEQNRDKKKRPRPYGVDDFLKRGKKRSWESQLDHIRAINTRLRGKNLKDG
jgi:hypothetical protein